MLKKIIFITIILILIVFGINFWKHKEEIIEEENVASEVTSVLLVNKADKVEVNQGNSWIEVGKEMYLKEGDMVKTDENGEAVLLFTDGSKLLLDKNTQITINTCYIDTQTKKISIYQEIGNTWSRVQKLFDSQSYYEVETQTTLATVRGTDFTVSVNKDQDVDFYVERGEITAQAIEKKEGKRNVLSTAKIKPQEINSIPKASLAFLKNKGERMASPTRPITLEDRPALKEFINKKRRELEELEPINSVKPIIFSPRPKLATPSSYPLRSIIPSASPLASPLLSIPPRILRVIPSVNEITR